MKKCRILFVIIVCVILFSSTIYASKLEVVNSNSENAINDENIKFTKKIVNHDADKKEAEIELRIENLNKIEEEKQDVEIIIILDNSVSMEKVENNATRKNTTYKAATKFVDMLYNEISNLKVGIIQYSDKIQILSELTSDKLTVDNALKKYNKAEYGKSTKTDKVLNVVQSKFSEECENKIVVLLTDGYPEDKEATKEALKAIEENDISIFSLIVCKKSNISSIESVFGTEKKTTAGEVYYIEKDSEIENVFSGFTYEGIMKYLDHKITDIQIEDVFPQDILQYYDIEYGNIPSKGEINKTENNEKFVWKIDNLVGQETAIFKYKIKIKADTDVNKIIGIEMDTNETVNINYKDENGKKIQETLEKQPIIKIEEEDVYISAIVEDDDIIEENKIICENIESEVIIEEKQEFVIVDVTPKEENNEKEKSTNVNNTSSNIQKERLPQTGTWYETMIGISILLAVILAIKIKLSTKDIFIVKK